MWETGVEFQPEMNSCTNKHDLCSQKLKTFREEKLPVQQAQDEKPTWCNCCQHIAKLVQPINPKICPRKTRKKVVIYENSR